jgi:hypothetical protein
MSWSTVDQVGVVVSIVLLALLLGLDALPPFLCGFDDEDEELAA